MPTATLARSSLAALLPGVVLLGGLAPVAPARAQQWLTPCQVVLIDGSEAEGVPSQFRVEVTGERVSSLFTREDGFDTISPMQPIPYSPTGSYGFRMQMPPGSGEATDWQFRIATMESPDTLLVESWRGRLWTEQRQNWAVRLRCVPGTP